MNILVISLGCDKNLVDTENMLGMMTQKGWQMVDDEEQADAILINTCCFINDAKEESIQSILEMSAHRRDGRCRALIVTGCLAERYKEEIRKEIPEVDAVLGTASYDRITEVIEQVLEGSHPELYGKLDRTIIPKARRIVTTGGHYAHLKIAEGCDKHCTYCIIPKIRGPYRSIPMEELERQAEELAEQGVKELILVAQETTIYGVDLYGEKSLHILLRRLCRIQGIRWIRILYCYPEEIYDELISTIKEEPKICHYLDIPIQHASNEILRRMGRRTTKEELIAIIEKLRREIPDIVLRTTLITGFPGEEDSHHVELMSFVDEMEFDRLGVFAYSQEEGTPAAMMENQVPEEVKQMRRGELMELQHEIAMDLSEARVGQKLWVMIEGQMSGEQAYVSRSYADAPGVDGYVFVPADETLVSGDFVRVEITAAMDYDLIGEIADESAE